MYVLEIDQDVPKDQAEKDFGKCIADVDIIPILFSTWSIQYMVFYLFLILFKKNEDYIARYS
jgi:hypothetical protein